MLSKFTQRCRLCVLLGLALLLAGCIQTSAEPEIVSTRILSPAPTTVELDASNVPASFDLNAGASIYVDRCETCHGEAGNGDGPTAAGIECEMPVFSLREASVTISDWFLVIANGTRVPPDPTCPMPFWKNTLSQAEMWNVAAYVYGFGPNADTVVAANPDPQSTEEPTDETPAPTVVASPETPVATSEETPIIAATTEETPAPTEALPAATEEVGDTATPAADSTFTLIGTVTNGTTGEPLPAPLPISLYIVGLDDSGNPQELYDAEVTLDENMSYTFTNVPLTRGILSLQVTFAGINQYSDFLLLPNDIQSTTHSMDMVVYETTTDDSNITIRNAEALVDAVTSESSSLIYQTFEFVNNGNTAYIGDDGLTVKIPIPADAVNPSINSLGSDSTRFVMDGDSIRDTFPLMPGEANGVTVEISYNINYTGSMTVRQILPYSVDSLGVYTYQPRALEIVSDLLSPAAAITANNTTYSGKRTTSPLTAGSTFVYTIRDTSNTPSVVNNPETDTTEEADSSSSFLQDNANLILGLGILLIVAGGMYLAYDLQKTRILAQANQVKPTRSGRETKADLLAEIAALDDAFERGELKEEYYQQQREALKEKLRQYFN